MRHQLHLIFRLSDKVQNNTIEDRVSLLELQVVDLEENVTDLDDDINFLFDEQVIQDERLLELEQTSDQVVVELAEINVNIQGRMGAHVIFDPISI